MLGLTLRDRITNVETRRTRLDDAMWSEIGQGTKQECKTPDELSGLWRGDLDKMLTPTRGAPPARWSDDIKCIYTNCLQEAQHRVMWNQLREAYVH